MDVPSSRQQRRGTNGLPELWDALRASGFVMGIPLTRWWPDREHQYLVALTELHYPQIRDLIQEVKRHAHDS